MGRILVVDDELPVQRLLADMLEADGHEVRVAADGAGALTTIAVWHPDAVVLDLDLGGEPGGLEVCRWIRLDPERARLGILVLTGRIDEATEIGLFDAGADDYMRKQRFEAPVLCKRLRGLLRRLRAQPSTPRTLAWGPLTLIPERVEAELNGRAIALTHTQLRMLELLVERRGGIVLRRKLFELCAPDCDPTSSRAVDVQINQIRKKFGSDRGLIRAAYGTGYRLVSKETAASEDARETPSTPAFETT